MKYIIYNLEKLRTYEALGTIDELSKRVKEEDILKFYYCESEDKYLVGQRVDRKYYGEVGKTGLYFCMSRHLPWGETIKDILGKEYIYPSEPKEIPFFEWLVGFLKQKGVEL
jgi:hypothetical protein